MPLNTLSPDEVAIRHVMDVFEDAWNAHDAKAYASLFAEDAEFVNIQGMIAYGREGVERFHRPLFEAMFRGSHLTVEEVRIRFLKPDVAVADARWQMTGALDPLGIARPLRYGLTSVVMMPESGAWKIKVAHNQDLFINPPH